MGGLEAMLDAPRRWRHHDEIGREKQRFLHAVALSFLIPSVDNARPYKKRGDMRPFIRVRGAYLAISAV